MSRDYLAHDSSVAVENLPSFLPPVRKSHSVTRASKREREGGGEREKERERERNCVCVTSCEAEGQSNARDRAIFVTSERACAQEEACMYACVRYVCV